MLTCNSNTYELLRRILDLFAEDVKLSTGQDLEDANGNLNRKALGTVVFSDPAKRKKLGTDISSNEKLDF
jgi:dephospho-CoA kinase